MPIGVMTFPETESPISQALSTYLKTLEGAKAAEELPYAGLTKIAEAGSKLAYRDLMAPQFMAKLMGNQDILANLTPEQRKKSLDSIYQAATNQSTTNQMIDRGILGNTYNRLNEAKNTPTASELDRQAIANLQPGQSYTVQTPQNIQMPEQAPQQQQSEQPDTFAEKAGRFKGIEKESEEAGKIRAQDIQNLDEQYQQATESEDAINHLIDISQSPQFKNMRNTIPFFQDKQLSVLSKLGTPEQQQMIGDFLTTTQKQVASTLGTFKGRVLDKEVTLVNNMKVSPNDTWNVMIGKLESLATFNKLQKERAQLTADLMEQNHMRRAQAMALADKQLNADDIRADIKARLNQQSDNDPLGIR